MQSLRVTENPTDVKLPLLDTTSQVFDRQEFCFCGNSLPLPTANGGRPFKYCSPDCQRIIRSWRTGRSNGKWTRKQRQEILERDNHTCIYCGCPTTGIDHVIPIKFDGKTEKSNGVACCPKCNSTKASFFDIRGLAHLTAKGESFGLSSKAFAYWRDTNRARLHPPFLSNYVIPIPPYQFIEGEQNESMD